MALKRKANEITKWQNCNALKILGKEIPYSFAGLVNCLSTLQELGYLYEKEEVYGTGFEALWQENPSAPAQAQVAEQWQKRRVTRIVLYFRQLITGETLCLHVYPAQYPKKELCRTVIEVTEQNPATTGSKTAIENSAPYFEALLHSLSLMPRPRRWQEVSSKALQLTENDSLLTTLAKLHYIQPRVGRLSELREKKKVTHWVGEFTKADTSSEGKQYLYILVTHTDVLQNETSKVYCELTPKICILSSPQPLEEVNLPGVGTMTLEKMTWEGFPFSNYYDLPDISLLVRIPTKEYEPHPDNLHEIFHNLYTEGYQYRREIAMVKGTYDCEDNNFLMNYDVSPEYLIHNIYQLTLEFIHPVTHCRKVVLISSDKILVRFCNGHWGSDLSYHYSCRFQDHSHDSRHFSDDPETKSPFSEEEIFPVPLLQHLLVEHHLIEPDQIKITNLMENREFNHWFSDPFPEFCYWFTAEDFVPDEQSSTSSLESILEQNKENIARCRRIFRHLRYPLTCTTNIHTGRSTVEIYANSTKERAFFLIYDDYNYFVRFVDKYMDVNGALTF